MYVGLAGALLVFSGVWHGTEWLMDGRRRDTLRLVPVGLIYLILGCLLVTLTGGSITLIAAILLPAIGGMYAFWNLGKLEVRKWVIWSFIVLDIVIVLALAIALLS